MVEFNMAEVSKLADRQETQLSGRSADGSYEPKKLREQQYNTEMSQVRRKQISAKLQQEYQSVSQDFKTYEEIVAGRDKGFSVDPNVLIDLEPYEQEEATFQSQITATSQSIAQKQQVLDRQAQRLARLGTKVDLKPIDEFRSALEVYGQTSSQERLAFVTGIQQEQQRDVKEFEELISTVNLSPVLVTRQEQLFNLAQQKPDLISKPYIYDQWEEKQQLQTGMTALGLSVTDLKQREGAKIEYYEDAPTTIKRITLTDKYAQSIERGKEKNIISYDTYTVEFGKEGNIVREVDYTPQKTMYNWTKSSKDYQPFRIGVAAEVLYSGGKAIKKTEFATFGANTVSESDWYRVEYKPFEQKVTTFQNGRIAQQQMFKPYESVRTSSPGSTYITRKITIDASKDYVGGVSTVFAAPRTNIQGWATPAPKLKPNPSNNPFINI